MSFESTFWFSEKSSGSCSDYWGPALIGVLLSHGKKFLLFITFFFFFFRTGNSSKRSSNPFRSDIDRSWFDMVDALLVPGRVNFSISSTLSDPTFGLVFCSYTINGGLPDICCNVSNSMLVLRLSLNKSSNLVLFDPQLLWGTKDEIQSIPPFKWFSLLLVPVPNSSPGSSQCLALSILRGCNINKFAHDQVTT